MATRAPLTASLQTTGLTSLIGAVGAVRAANRLAANGSAAPQLQQAGVASTQAKRAAAATSAGKLRKRFQDANGIEPEEGEALTDVDPTLPGADAGPPQGSPRIDASAAARLLRVSVGGERAEAVAQYSPVSELPGGPPPAPPGLSNFSQQQQQSSSVVVTSNTVVTSSTVDPGMQSHDYEQDGGSFGPRHRLVMVDPATGQVQRDAPVEQVRAEYGAMEELPHCISNRQS